MHRSVFVILATGLLACGGRSPTATGSSDAAPATSSTSSCQQQLDDGGLSIAQCTCAAMIALAKSEERPDGSNATTVLAVYSTTSDAINPNYDLGLPSGTPVCFVSMSGEFFHSSPPGVSAGPDPYAFVIYTESPWRSVEGGSGSTQPAPGSD